MNCFFVLKKKKKNINEFILNISLRKNQNNKNESNLSLKDSKV